MSAFVRGGAIAACLLVSSTALAHPSFVTTRLEANKTVKMVIGIGHGCENDTGGVDTYKIRIEIPAGFTNVRPMWSDFGKPTLIKSGTTVTAIEWVRPTADLAETDTNYYELTVRMRSPDAAYSQLQFNVTQTCRTTGGVETVVPWDQPAGSTTGNPAPILSLTPARTSPTGWNKFTLPVAVPNAQLGAYFGDAQIVWKGTSAYSSNSNTAAQIASTSGVTALTSDLAAGDEVWVRY